MRLIQQYQPNRTQFIIRVITACVTIGCLVSICNISIAVYKSMTSNKEQVNRDQIVLSSFDRLRDATLPIEQRIANHEALIVQLRNPKNVADQRRILASLYAQ